MKRERIEIMAQILALCAKPRRKTRIMYRTNLSHAQLKTYLALLTSRDLIAHNSDEYHITSKGLLFLEAFNHLRDMLEDRARSGFERIISETYEEVEILQFG